MQTIRKTCNVAGKQMLLNKQMTDFFCSGSNLFEMKSSNRVVYRKMTSIYNRLQNCTVLLIYDALAIFFILLVCSPLHWVLCPMASCLKIEWDWSPLQKKSRALPSLNRQLLSLLTREERMSSSKVSNRVVQDLLKSMWQKPLLSLPVVALPCSCLDWVTTAGP